MAAAKPKTHICDVAIAGGGPVGMTLALALARRGYDVIVADGVPQPKAGQAVNDSRALFIAYGCWRIFRALGLDEALLANAESVTSVEAKGRIGGVSFLAEECSEPVLGYMVEAARLAPVLHAAAKAEKRITLLAPAKIESVVFGDAEAVLKLASG